MDISFGAKFQIKPGGGGSPKGLIYDASGSFSPLNEEAAQQALMAEKTFSETELRNGHDKTAQIRNISVSVGNGWGKSVWQETAKLRDIMIPGKVLFYYQVFPHHTPSMWSRQEAPAIIQTSKQGTELTVLTGPDALIASQVDVEA
jgi:hypothetical protein